MLELWLGPSDRTHALALEHAVEKYGLDGLLASSADRGWRGLSAELRSHGDGVVAWKNPQPHGEMCVNLHGSRATVTRRGVGIVNRTIAERGTIWLTPAGLEGGVVDISDFLPQVLHVFLSPDCFAPAALGIALDRSLTEALRYDGGFQDPLLAGIAYAIAAELKSQTAGGQVLIEALATSLAARLVLSHLGDAASCALRPAASTGLDRHRLTRVLDFIEAHLEDQLTIDRLARVACLSRFHFARAFKAATGQPPHRYVSNRRLQRAKGLLAQSDRPLADIALALSFSCQANFTRAFRDATGRTPGQYRRDVGPPCRIAISKA
jgi:AraC family transcriptional regulator